MKIKIVGDGTYEGTNIIDIESGERIQFIESMELYLGPDREANLNLHMTRLPIEIEANLDTVTLITEKDMGYKGAFNTELDKFYFPYTAQNKDFPILGT
jgi:hypothetical protein